MNKEEIEDLAGAIADAIFDKIEAERRLVKDDLVGAARSVLLDWQARQACGRVSALSEDWLLLLRRVSEETRRREGGR